uniref:Ig-like domain-containing protein n=1 Tax=Amphilophus citrinellus TaxID=61819 RepID=A0A3Q0S6E3_AMPCI
LELQCFIFLLFSGEVLVIGSGFPIIAAPGDDVILPCHLEPMFDVRGLTVEWSQPDLKPDPSDRLSRVEYVHLYRDRKEVPDMKLASYFRRTELFMDDLKHGNISLKILNVSEEDSGRYRCFIPKSHVDLVVVSAPVIKVISNHSSRVVLQCESAGWYPEPELLWLAGEGNLVSAGPTETLRGPDDLYTVSSRVTVEKRHSNNITCRVQQKNINQSRETHIHVPGTNNSHSGTQYFSFTPIMFSLIQIRTHRVISSLCPDLQVIKAQATGHQIPEASAAGKSVSPERGSWVTQHRPSKLKHGYEQHQWHFSPP